MATVTISQHWPDDGGATIVSIDFEDSYPEAMSRAADEASRTWAKATGGSDDDE